MYSRIHPATIDVTPWNFGYNSVNKIIKVANVSKLKEILFRQINDVAGGLDFKLDLWEQSFVEARY